ncbi:MAG: PQQ-binding-like beta-propeller repeat protein, partial [Planctomycetota bacterium]
MKRSERLAITDKRMSKYLVLGCVFLFASAVQGRQWSRFRGPNGQGISDAETIPIKWTQKDYNWKVKLPGVGYSSPVIWGEKVFVTCGDQKAGRGILLALSVPDGKVLWQKQCSLTKYRMNSSNSYATATPAADGDHVYALWATANQTLLVALDHDGEQVWRKTFGGFNCQHGPGISPIVVNDIVVFTHEHERIVNDAQSVWIAVDRKSGKKRWELERQTSPKTSYSTPCVYSSGTDKPLLVFTSFAHGITGVDPRTGAVVWEAKSAFISRVISSPVIAGELLIGTCGDGSSGKRLIAIRPGKGSKSAEPKEAYKIESSTVTYVPTSVAKDGLLFTFHDRGEVSCLRSATGEQLWREKPAGPFYGSPVWVNGNLYCITRKGEVVVVKAASTYELLAVNPLGEES